LPSKISKIPNNAFKVHSYPSKKVETVRATKGKSNVL